MQSERDNLFSGEIECLQKAIDLAHAWLHAYTKLGQIFYDMGDFKRAIEHYSKAYQLDSSYLGVLNGIEVCFELTYQFEECKRMARKVIEAMDSQKVYEEMPSIRGNTYWMYGNLEIAEITFKEYFKKVWETGDKEQIRNLWSDYHQLGWVHVVKGDLDESEHWFQKSDSIQENSLANAGLFQISHKKGQYQLADEYLAKAIHQVGYSASMIVGDGLFLLGIYDWQEEVILLFTKSL